jgi:Uma2 family endonuclease
MVRTGPDGPVEFPTSRGGGTMAVTTMERPESEEDATWQYDRRRYAAEIRALHDQLDPSAGWRVEIIEGQLVASPAPMPAHGCIVEVIRTAVASSLPPTHGAFEGIGLEEPETDRYTPDLGVWPRKAIRGGSVRSHPKLCMLAVEVTSPGQAKRDDTKAEAYARCGIPVSLVVDQTSGACVVFTEPLGALYRNRHEVLFGETLTLPLETPVTIDTSEF